MCLLVLVKFLKCWLCCISFRLSFFFRLCRCMDRVGWVMW